MLPTVVYLALSLFCLGSVAGQAPGPAPALAPASAMAPAPALAPAPGMASAPALAPNSASAPASGLAPSVYMAPALAPGPSSAYGCSTALSVLQAAGRYDTFLSLLDSTDLVSRLDDPTHFITILAPTDAGVNAWLENRGTTLAALEGSGSVLEGIMEYHILPSPVLVSALQNGNSFNTLYERTTTGTMPEVQTITVARSMDTITVQGALSSANITSTGVLACGSVVYSLDGLLIPSISLQGL